jgi:hypothetical protein
MCDYGKEAWAYLRAVCSAYRNAPFTPHRITLYDLDVAEKWYDLGIPLDLIRTAIALVGCRMILDGGEVRSLAYYLPLIHDLLEKRKGDGALHGGVRTR